MRDGRIVILHVLGGLSMGGAESRIMDVWRHMDREKFTFDFLLNEAPGYYEKEALELGSRIYRGPKYKIINAASFKNGMRKLFEEHGDTDIVEGHSTNTAALYLPLAKKAGMVTLAHAHSAGVEPGLSGMLKKWTRRGLPDKTDYMLACSTDAAKAVYGTMDRVRLIPNSEELERFAPTAENLRGGDSLKKELGIEDRFVVGHVGRFHYAKNHPFLLEVFKELLKQRKDALLLLVGDGEELEKVKQKAGELGISENVIFAGMCPDPAPYYQAMDVLVFPSFYEGLPGTIVESQASGVPALLSDTVTRDVDITELAVYEPLSSGVKSWAEKALALAEKYPRSERQSLMHCSEKMADAGFDIKKQVLELQDFYGSVLREDK